MPPINFGLNIWGPNNATTTAPVITELETFNLFLIVFKLIKGGSFGLLEFNFTLPLDLGLVTTVVRDIP